MSERSDADLVAATKRGDQGAFRTLVEKHQKSLFNAAYRITSNREDALDALQTAFLKVHLNLESFDCSRRFFSWVFKIVVNESLNMVERRSRHRGELVAVEIAESKPNPERVLEQAERDALVQQAILQIKPTHRVVLVLRHFNNLSYQEIAEITEVPEKTVKSRLFSARVELRKQLQESGVVDRVDR